MDNQVTIEEMNALAANILALRDQEDAASEVKKQITRALEFAESKMMELLEAHGLQNYRAPAGLCSMSFRTSVKTPKTPEQKAAFYNWLKEIGRYDDLISVNSQTLNSFYKEQLELAQEQGKEDFEVPGITEVTMTPNLSFKRSK